MLRTGVLLVNLGTPAAPTPKAVRSYLAEFLSDPLVVQLPRLIWLPILYGIILPFRPKSVAKLYQAIWTEQGSPLLVHSQSLANKLQNALGENFQVEIAMRYGKPNIETQLNKLKQSDKIVIIPLFPQFSKTTTLSVIEKVKHLVNKQNHLPPIEFIDNYANNTHYIQALTDSIQTHWQVHGKADKLLISFHGIPKKYTEQGDPYLQQCLTSVKELTKNLQLTNNEYSYCFQSRFGKAEWLKPYTDLLLKDLAKQGVKHVDIICPGFAVDCLETLEEIKERYKEVFLEAGGQSLRYIPALNDSDAHVELFKSLVENTCIFEVDSSTRFARSE